MSLQGSLARSSRLSLSNISQRLLEAQYAVRGQIPMRAAEIKAELASNPASFGFTGISELNIGNPQFFTFEKIESTRLVINRLLHHFSSRSVAAPVPGESDLPPSLEDEVQELVREYASLRQKQASSGAISFAAQSIARSIHARDGLESRPDNIFVSNGASSAITQIVKMLIDSPRAGIMCSVPTYPLYSGLVSLFGGSFVKYNLDEDDNWNISVRELERSFRQATDAGIRVKAIVLINPGNPTGNVFDLERMREILDFCHRNSILILADEVYQENIYNPSKQFYSFKSLLDEADSSVRNSQELISFHSVSKGYLGECGLRGGYMELDNIDPAMVGLVRGLARQAPTNMVGELCVDLKSRFMSGELAHLAGLQELFDSQTRLKQVEFLERAQMVESALNACEGVRTNPIDGAMYAFPRLYLPRRFVQRAEEMGVIPDFLYCKELLEQTGLCTVPGSGFGQVEGTYHLRTTILPSPNSRLNGIMERFKEFNDALQEKYS